MIDGKNNDTLTHNMVIDKKWIRNFYFVLYINDKLTFDNRQMIMENSEQDGEGL